jgi:hypothetical protein
LSGLTITETQPALSVDSPAARLAHTIRASSGGTVSNWSSRAREREAARSRCIEWPGAELNRHCDFQPRGNAQSDRKLTTTTEIICRKRPALLVAVGTLRLLDSDSIRTLEHSEARGRRLPELLEPRLRGDQVARGEAFGEPGVERGEEGAGVVRAARRHQPGAALAAPRQTGASTASRGTRRVGRPGSP